MSHNKVTAVFTTPITDGLTQGLVIETQRLLKIRTLFLSSHIRGTSFRGIPILPHSKISNRNHHYQSLNFNQELVTNLHQTSMCLHIRRYKKIPIKSLYNR